MLSVETQWRNRLKIDPSALNVNASASADRMAEIMTNFTKLALVAHSKIATGGTLRSIRWRRGADRGSALFGIAATGTFRRQVVGARSLKFIMSGRRAGAKMPIRLVGTGPRGGKRFEPLPAMMRWFVALNLPRSSWWPIMRAISRRGIKPTPIRQTALRMAAPAIQAEKMLMRARIAQGIIKRAV